MLIPVSFASINLEISNVEIIKTPYQLKISFDTKDSITNQYVLTTGSISYGTDEFSLSESISLSLSSYEHEVTLPSLEDDTTYYYNITMTDTSSNIATRLGSKSTLDKEEEELLITELMYHPEDSSQNGKEWIEIYNDGNTTEYLENWILYIDGDTYYISRAFEVKIRSLDEITDEDDAFEVEAKTYFIITDDADEFEREYDNRFRKILDTSNDVKVFEVDRNFSLDDSEAEIQIQNPLGKKADKLKYEDDWGNRDDDGDGYTLSRISYSDSNSEANWYTSNTIDGTPGWDNDVEGYEEEEEVVEEEIIEEEEEVVIEEEEEVVASIFSSIFVTPSSNTNTIKFNSTVSTSPEIHYGTSTSYGSIKRFNANSTSHDITLTNLIPDTLYYYKIVSVDGESNGYNFRTKKSTVTPPIIIDTNNNSPIIQIKEEDKKSPTKSAWSEDLPSTGLNTALFVLTVLSLTYFVQKRLLGKIKKG